jgi:serine/threonine protein kinase
MEIVNFRKKFLFFLIMLYYRFGNLKNLYNNSSIAIKKIIIFLFQIFTIFKYLYSRDVAHRNFKSKNIFIEFRYPFNIKFANFDFANNKLDLKIFYGTYDYTAPKFYLNKIFNSVINLWSVDLVVYRYIYDLSKTVKMRRGNRINQRAKINEREFF